MYSVPKHGSGSETTSGPLDVGHAIDAPHTVLVTSGKCNGRTDGRSLSQKKRCCGLDEEKHMGNLAVAARRTPERECTATVGLTRGLSSVAKELTNDEQDPPSTEMKVMSQRFVVSPCWSVSNFSTDFTLNQRGASHVQESGDPDKLQLDLLLRFVHEMLVLCAEWNLPTFRDGLDNATIKLGQEIKKLENPHGSRLRGSFSEKGNVNEERIE
ncbi:hypothetical protein EDB86DRAFT_2829502 [Lactarius hatsudake]|nr:hypothetical protein EDB86DRAFT_2829502 [Lactarius hatsudake]